MKDKRKVVINAIIFILLIFITYYVIFRNESIESIMYNIKQINIVYAILGVIAMEIFYIVGGLNLKLILESFGYKAPLLKMTKFAHIDGFFSAITPASSGGQPMEIYYMSKEGYKASHTTFAILIHMFGYELSIVIFGLIGSILNPEIFDNNLMILFVVGTIFNLFMFLMITIALFSKKITNKIVYLFIKILTFLKIKKIDKINKKIDDELETFHSCSKYINTHKKEFIRAICISFLQVAINYSIIYFSYKAFNLNNSSFLYLFEMQGILHCAVSSIPLPGSIGVSESAFLLLYPGVFNQNIMKDILLLHRTINFYLFVIINLIIVLINNIYLTKKHYK